MEEIETKPEEMIEEKPEIRVLDKLKIHKLKILGGVLGILVFAGAVFGAYKLGQRQIQPSQPTPTPVAVTTPTPDPTVDWKTYTNEEHGFEFKYPSDWMIENESYQSLILMPVVARSWQPSEPSDIWKDPHVRIDMGGSIREKLGPANFPAVVNPGDLRAWLEQKAHNGEARNFLELTIDNVQAFELDEIYVPNCEKVVYWRATNLESLVRIATGCESPYLGKFNLMLSTFKFTSEEAVGEKVYCKEPRPEVCTMECIVNPPYICGSDGKSYCTECQACSKPEVEWYVIQDELCEIE